MNPFDQNRSTQQAGNVASNPKPAIKNPHTELSAEMQYAHHVQANPDISVNGGLLYCWNGHCWKLQDDADATRMALNWLSKNMGKRATVATAESCIKAALLMANKLPAKPADLVIPLYDRWLWVDEQGLIQAERPNRTVGVTHVVPIAASMNIGDYCPAPLPDDSMFARFLASSLPDPEVRSLLQTYIGYTLTGHTDHQVAQFWIGEKGGNGKSTMLKIAMALHERAVPVQLDKLDGFYLNSLIGATLVACDETPKGKINQQMLKSLISGGSTQIDRKYKDTVGYANSAKFIICANHLPALIDQSDAFWRRFHVIEWNQTFTNGRAILNLDQQIIKHELHLVLDWAFLGLQKLQRDGKFIVPEAVNAAKHHAKLDSNSVASWAEYAGITYCSPSQLYLDKSVLFHDYVEYCRHNHLTPCALPQFYTRLRSLFPDILEARQTVGSGMDKKRVRCVNLTMGVFSPDDLSDQVQQEMDEISQAFGYGADKE